MGKDPSLFAERLDFGLYNFALLDPVDHIDPWGLESLPELCLKALLFARKVTSPFRLYGFQKCVFGYVECDNEGKIRCDKRYGCPGKRNMCYNWVDDCCFRELVACQYGVYYDQARGKFVPFVPENFDRCTAIPPDLPCKMPLGCPMHGS